MPRRLIRIALALGLLLSSQAWALGLGEIRLQSALNEPLRAEIELLSATPDELADLKIGMASAETFDRYGIDRPVFLQNIRFQVRESGRVDGNIIEVRSAQQITEPFLTFLVEASWARGRLLREYTILLDPPTFAPPAAAQAPAAVTAPTRTAPADSGRIERAAPAPAPAPRAEAIQPPRSSAPARPAPADTAPAARAQPVIDDSPYDTTAGGDYTVQRGETLWGITQRVIPDSRLTMNQTMLAIFEANPAAFDGNINRLRAGASLRVPSADEVFRISRGDALNEVQRQHRAWGSGQPAQPADTSTQPNLTLVPPDDDYLGDSDGAGTDAGQAAAPVSREQAIEDRIAELMAADVPRQQSLIEIRDNELAALRQELANIRGEVYEPPVDQVFVDDAPLDAAPEDPFADIQGETGEPEIDEPAEDAAPDTTEAQPAPTASRREPEPGILDQVLSVLSNFWTIVVAAIVAVGAVLFWFMRRGRDGDDAESWRGLDADEADDEQMTGTERLRAPTVGDESIVVVEQKTAPGEETIDSPGVDFEAGSGTYAAIDDDDATGEFGSLEDTFSSETAVNLDQSDPVAEADFHMAYGLYDQAADLINGALQAEPEREDLLTKLCEIYFVWGNRDAFVDAAGRLKSAGGGTESADWDKIVIMGQQIAGDDPLFAGAGVAEATKAVDLSFEAGMDETGSLDMELIAESGGDNDIVDLGGDDEATAALDPGEGVDLDLSGGEAANEASSFDLDIGGDSNEFDLDLSGADDGDDTDFDLTAEMPSSDATAEMPSPEPTVETPTIEQQFEGLGGTAELPSLAGHDDDDETRENRQAGDETAEINLDDLGLDLDGLEETEVASLDDLEDTAETPALADTGINEALDDPAEVTGKNPEVDPNATGVLSALDSGDTSINEALSETGSTEIDPSMLDATGLTQVLSDDEAVDTTSDLGGGLGDDDATLLAGLDDNDDQRQISDDQETLLASLDDDDQDDYDFAKTEALPADVFTGNASLDETGELPAVASTDVDLDLDDLTAALEVSEIGDTVEQLRDDATIEQPRPREVGTADDETSSTLSLGPEDMSDDLHEARTMTEVGTKLDLARAYVDMGDPAGARSILEEVLDEGDEGQRQQAQQLLDSLPA